MSGSSSCQWFPNRPSPPMTYRWVKSLNNWLTGWSQSDPCHPDWNDDFSVKGLAFTLQRPEWQFETQLQRAPLPSSWVLPRLPARLTGLSLGWSQAEEFLMKMDLSLTFFAFYIYFYATISNKDHKTWLLFKYSVKLFFFICCFYGFFLYFCLC